MCSAEHPQCVDLTLRYDAPRPAERMRRRSAMRAAILAASLAGAFAPAFPSESPLVTVPAIDNVRISPSGDRILAVSTEGQRRVLVVTDVATGQAAIAYRPAPKAQSLHTCEWVSDIRIVCSIFVYPAPGPPWPRERIVRLILVGHDGSNERPSSRIPHAGRRNSPASFRSRTYRRTRRAVPPVCAHT